MTVLTARTHIRTSASLTVTHKPHRRLRAHTSTHTLTCAPPSLHILCLCGLPASAHPDTPAHHAPGDGPHTGQGTLPRLACSAGPCGTPTRQSALAANPTPVFLGVVSSGPEAGAQTSLWHGAPPKLSSVPPRPSRPLVPGARSLSSSGAAPQGSQPSGHLRKPRRSSAPEPSPSAIAFHTQRDQGCTRPS